MKKHSLGAVIVSFSLAAIASNLSAQHYDPRIDVPEIVNPSRGFDQRGDWQRRNRADLDQLNADVAQVRARIGNSRDKEIRAHFHVVVRATDRLNSAYNRGTMRGWELRQRIGDIRQNLDRVQRELDRRGMR